MARAARAGQLRARRLRARRLWPRRWQQPARLPGHRAVRGRGYGSSSGGADSGAGQSFGGYGDYDGQGMGFAGRQLQSVNSTPTTTSGARSNSTTWTTTIGHGARIATRSSLTSSTSGAARAVAAREAARSAKRRAASGIERLPRRAAQVPAARSLRPFRADRRRARRPRPRRKDHGNEHREEVVDLRQRDAQGAGGARRRRLPGGGRQPIEFRPARGLPPRRMPVDHRFLGLAALAAALTLAPLRLRPSGSAGGCVADGRRCGSNQSRRCRW